MTAPDYGRAFGLWREAAGPDWDAYVAHPFVQGLGDGRLAAESYRHYLIQDYVFLVHFARAWALAVVKSETLDEMKAAAATVHALTDMEMSLHVQSCAGWGIDESSLFVAPESAANLAYTRYVIDAGVSGDLADLLAALAPCVLGYGEIGMRLAGAAETSHYGDWISVYASEDYQETCRAVGALIDGALVRRLGERFETSPRWERVTARFVTATRLEAGFWQMGLDLA